MSPAEALARRARAAGLVPCGAIRSYNRDSRGVLWLRGRDMAHLPDLEDPATLGCLLALVRDAYDDGGVHTYRDLRWLACNGEGTHLCAHPGAREKRQNGERCCIGGPCHAPAFGDSEAEALVVALEAAPVRR